MEQKITNLVFLVVFTLVGGCATDKPTESETTAADGQAIQQARELFGTVRSAMDGQQTDNEKQIELGRKLYFEKRLSINDTQSCNSCHRIDEKKGGVDNLPTSPGAKGKFGDRNSPTVLNAGLQIAQFWDGRAKDLAAQAKGPILNPIEMGMPSGQTVIEKLSVLPEYVNAFSQAFPHDTESLTYDNVARAIAAFEKTLITHDRFDDFQEGQSDALTAEEKTGLKTFIETGCAACHNGPLLGGSSFHKMGIVSAYDNSEDIGREALTKSETDRYVFKVPTLRNIVLTGPYFHDGRVPALEDAVRTMAKLQLNRSLAEHEVNAIVAFLETLTDKNRE